MKNDLLATLIRLAPDRPPTANDTLPATQESPPEPSTMSEPPPQASSSASPAVSPLFANIPTTSSSPPMGLPPVEPTPFQPLSGLASIPTTSDPKREPLTPEVVEDLHAKARATRVVPNDSGGILYKRETALHRFVAILHLQGIPREEIAVRLGISQAQVARVITSQNARQFMGEKLETVFKDQTLQRLTDLAEKAVTELEAILDNPEVRAADKLKAISMVLDRRFGQTTQVVRHVQGDLSKMSDADLMAVIGETSTVSDTVAGEVVNV